MRQCSGRHFRDRVAPADMHAFNESLMQFFRAPCYPTGKVFLSHSQKVSNMSRVQINRNTLHATLCIAASAVISIALIYHAIRWIA